ncbi:2S seed storage albumin protein-like [Humulus lupulus]|uniref:2S seed storage albumin protein-like n=1 Tax=Humulus lupulus TaxID=3486 RepID=UPI002B40ADA4|nr:2S seed storage albumin protein-like [Humulus lupulus]
MTRLTILAAAGLLVAVLFVVNTSVRAHRTTITTVEIESENPEPYQRCEEQIRRQNLRQCQQYIREGRGQYGVLEFNNEAENYISSSQTQELQQCCNQLKRMDQQCQCEAMTHIMRQQRRQQGQQLSGERLQQMVQRAQNLPRVCGSGPQQCDVRVDLF